MPGSIQSFKSSFQTDLSRPSRFDVQIYPKFGGSYSLLYRCESAQLPGKTLATTEQRTYGPIEKFPYLMTYSDVDLTFMVTDDMAQKVFFDRWFERINPTNTNNFGYKSDYVADIIITQYDVTNRPAYSVKLIDAYPVSMNQLDLDWSTDSYHKLSVTFAYTRWERDFSFPLF
jgi:hypothetical protein